MGSFGGRLRQVREARGLNQAEFGALGGVRRNAQAMYESGERVPDVNYLEHLAAQGVDIHQLVVGDQTRDQAPTGLAEADRRDEGQDLAPDGLGGFRVLTDEEWRLIENFRRLQGADQAALARLLQTLAKR